VARVDGAEGTTLSGSFTVSAVGDCIVTRPLLSLAPGDGAFADVVTLLRGADAAFGNLETSIIDLTDTAASPSALPDDWATRAQPETALDLRALGFDVFGRANNHSTDWGVGGLLETSLWLDEAALVHAGAGATLAAARSPRYLETDAGRLGLVSMTTSAASGIAPALDAFGEVPARAGVHALVVRTTIVVTSKVMKALVAIRQANPESDVAWLSQHIDAEGDPPPVLELFGRRFELGEAMGVRHEVDDEALAGNLRAIRQASQHADVVIAAAHSHQGDSRPQEPHEFLRRWAHEAVDHGADVVAISGPHKLAPVELYRGRPIFYGLGNFVWSEIEEPIQRYFYDESRAMLRERFDRHRSDSCVERGLVRQRRHVPSGARSGASGTRRPRGAEAAPRRPRPARGGHPPWCAAHTRTRCRRTDPRTGARDVGTARCDREARRRHRARDARMSPAQAR